MLKTAPPGNSLVVQWSRLSIVTALAQVSCLIGEVRSHKMCNQKKKNPLLTTKSLRTTSNCGAVNLDCSRRSGSLPEAQPL